MSQPYHPTVNESGSVTTEAEDNHLPQFGHQFSSIAVGGNASAHFGDVYNNYYTQPTQRPLSREGSIRNDILELGLYLGKAPKINQKLFIGRQNELKLIEDSLSVTNNYPEQRVLVLGGIGGIGKTQLMLAYARQCYNSYKSIIWLNATSETTLKDSFRTVAARLLTIPEYQKCDDQQVLLYVHRWLCLSQNTRWLLLFDNYDDPQDFSIEKYYPPASHGAIIVTTRSPEEVTGTQVIVRPLENVSDGLQILQTRSERAKISSDYGAHRLAERLAGLPLALATAGAYLKKSNLSCEQYLDGIEQRWNIDARRPVRLSEYQSRTLYSTWDVSFSRLKNDDPDAAQMLALLAYFDHQALWYELFRSGVGPDAPSWLLDLVSDSTNFDCRMATLVEYCFVDVLLNTQSYSIHACVHDWTLAGLSEIIDGRSYWYAMDCVTGLIDAATNDSWSHVKHNRIARHAARLAHPRFQILLKEQLSKHRLEQVVLVAGLLHMQKFLSASERMYQHALDGLLTVLGPDDPFAFSVLNDFGNLCFDQSMFTKAEEVYQQALEGRERVLGPSDPISLRTVNNLGSLNAKKGDFSKAEAAFERALTGQEKNLGADNPWTLKTVHNLGSLYLKQGKTAEAEQMYIRAFEGNEKTLGPNHSSTLKTLNNLASLYVENQRLALAEETYRKVLAGKELTLGLENSSTLATVHNLGVCLRDQGNLTQAEVMFQRALAGKLKILGQNHPSTRITAKEIARFESARNEAKQQTSMQKDA